MRWQEHLLLIHRYIFIHIQTHIQHLCEFCASPQLHCFQVSRTTFTNTHTQININRSYQFSVYIHLASTHSCEALVLSPHIYECIWLYIRCSSLVDLNLNGFSLSYILHILAYIHPYAIYPIFSLQFMLICVHAVNLPLACSFFISLPPSPRPLSLHHQFALFMFSSLYLCTS